MADLEKGSDTATTVNPLTEGHGHGAATASSPLRIDVVELTYGVINEQKKVKRLLKNVTLSIQSGNMCALMGPSGAGKRLVSSYCLQPIHNILPAPAVLCWMFWLIGSW
jgi:ABC-type glutathione transport system ATPase component